jgi:hypothetical protein
MYYTNIYLSIIKNKLNYNLIYFNKKKKIWLILNINYYIIKNNNLYLKLIKSFCYENGLNLIFFDNWYKFGIKYNLIYKLFNI